MRRILAPLSLLCLLLGATFALAQPEARPAVGSCVLEGTVDAGSAAYLVSCVQRAREEGMEALLVRVDTPGGALESTRQITQAFLGAEVPVIVWVGPSGARAGSAGVFVTMASHFAGMAPGTNIGAAHPVMGPTGADPEEGGEHMAAKVVNDTAAFAEAIAKQRGRNAEWAVSAVRESASVDADRAVELRVVEVVAPTQSALLEAANGRKVQLPSGERELKTANARLVEFEPSMRQRLVHWLANPAVAYLLFIIGGLGIAIEMANPGMIAPGLIGGICLVLAMIAFSSLPIEAGAVVLLLIGIGLIVAELFVASGLLGAGGVALLILGGVLLVDRFDAEWFVEPSFSLSWKLLLPTVAALGGGALFVLLRAAEARKMPQRGGDAGLLGERGRALTDVGPEDGLIFVHGERWSARSATPIAAGASVIVRGVDGLVVTVEEIR